MLKHINHRIEALYVDILTLRNDDFEKVKSEPVILSFNASSGNAYAITLPKIENLNAAKEFASNPKISIVENGTMEVSELESVEIQKERTSTKMQEQEKRVVAVSKDISEAEPQSFKQMQNWWNKATPKERANFQQWVWSNPR